MLVFFWMLLFGLLIGLAVIKVTWYVRHNQLQILEKRDDICWALPLLNHHWLKSNEMWCSKMLNQSFTGIEGIENIEETSAWSKEMLKSSETKFLKNRNLLLHLLIQTSPILHRIVLQFIFDICYKFMTQKNHSNSNVNTSCSFHKELHCTFFRSAVLSSKDEWHIGNLVKPHDTLSNFLSPILLYPAACLH